MTDIATVLRRAAGAVLLLALLNPAAFCGERDKGDILPGHAAVAIIVGQAGSHRYRMQYEKLVGDLYRTLNEAYGYPGDRIFVFTENGEDMGGIPATGQAAPGTVEWLFNNKVRNGEPLLLILIGHANLARKELYFHTRSAPITASKLGKDISAREGPVSIIAALPHSEALIEPLEKSGNAVLASSEKSQRYQPAFFPALVKSLESLTEKKEELTLGHLVHYLQEEVDSYYAEKNLLKTEHMTRWPEILTGKGWNRLVAFDGDIKKIKEEKEPTRKAAGPAGAVKTGAAYWRKIADSLEGDEDSPVAVLFDKARVEFGERMDGRSLHHRVMLIREEEGRDAAQVRFPFNKKETEIELDWARTIQPDGSVVELDRERDMQFIPGPSGVYSSISTFHLYFPEIKPGSIVEYRYRTRWGPKGSSRMLSRLLQPKYPTERFEYEVCIPKKSKLNVRFMNLPHTCRPSVSKDDYVITHSISGKALPGLFGEPMSPPAYMRGISVSISPYRDWKEVSGWYARIADPRTEPSPAIEKLAKSITAGTGSDAEKLRKIYDWMINEIRYIHVPLGDHAYQPFPAERTYAQRYGDCKDKAALMISLLKAAGMEGYFALINAGHAPRVHPDFPTRAFNHAIVAVPAGPGTFRVLDPTSETTPFGYLPKMDQGRWILITHSRKPFLQQCPATEPGRNLVTIGQRYDDEGSLEAVSWEAKGSPFQEWRMVKKKLPGKRAREFLVFNALGLSPVEYRMQDAEEKEMEEGNAVLVDASLEQIMPYSRIKWTNWPVQHLEYTKKERTQPYYLETGFGYREVIEVPGKKKKRTWKKATGPLKLAVSVEPGESKTTYIREISLPAGTYDTKTYAGFYRAFMDFERESRKLLKD